MSKLLQFINQLHRDAVHDAAIMCRKKEKSSNCFNTNEKGVRKPDKLSSTNPAATYYVISTTNILKFCDTKL
jgi:hypothetical protein